MSYLEAAMITPLCICNKAFASVIFVGSLNLAAFSSQLTLYNTNSLSVICYGSFHSQFNIGRRTLATYACAQIVPTPLHFKQENYSKSHGMHPPRTVRTSKCLFSQNRYNQGKYTRNAMDLKCPVLFAELCCNRFSSTLHLVVI